LLFLAGSITSNSVFDLAQREIQPRVESAL
jgi:hypothetical protein